MADDFGLVGSEADTPVPSAVDDNGIGVPTSPSAGTLSPTSDHTFFQTLKYGLPGLGVGLLDTIGQSLHVIDNNAIPNLMQKVTGSGEGSFGDYYTQEQKPLQTAGDVATFWLPGKLAMDGLKTVNGLREAGSISAWAKNSTALDVILGNSAQLAAKEKAFVPVVNAALENQGGLWAGRTLSTPAILAAKRSYTAARAMDGARTAVAFEVGNYAAFNSSDLFYPPDMSVADQAKWAGAGVAVGAGLEMAAAKYALRMMQLGAVKAMTSTAGGLTVGVGKNAINFPSASPADVFNISPLAKDADKIMFRPQQRGVGITAYAGMDSDITETMKVSNNPANLKTNMYQNQVNIKKVLSTQIGAMAQDLHEFLPKTKLDQSQIDLGLKALKQNPTSLMFATKLANLPEDGAEAFYEDISKQTAKAQKDLETARIVASTHPDPVFASNTLFKARSAFAPVDAASKEMHYVLEPTGDWTIYKTRAENWLDNNTLASIKRQTYATPDPSNTGKILKNSKLLAKGDNPLVLHDNFRLEIPAAATPKDFSASYAMGSKMIDKYEPVEGQTLILTPQVNWRTLEMTSALAKAKPEVQQSIKLGEGFTSPDDVDFHVLNEKFQGFMKDMKDTSAPQIGKPGSLLNRSQSIGTNLTPAQVIAKYNLPVPVGSQPSPILEMFAHAKLQGMDDLNAMFPVRKSSDGFSQPVTQLEMLQQHLQDIAGVTPDVKIPIAGKLLEQTSDTKPVFVAATATPALSLADTNIQARVLAMRDVQLERLSKINPVDSPLVHGVIGKIVSAGQEGGELSGAALTARQVQTLQDGILSGTGQFVYQDRINEQYPALKALQLIAQDGDKFIANYVETLANKSLTPKFATILADKNKNDLFDFNRVEQAYRHGWEIERTQASNQGYQFVLKEDSKINQQLFKLHFPDEEEMPTTMPDMSVTAKKKGMLPLNVSKSAGELASAISEMSIQSGRENNVLRTSLGYNPIQLRDFHLPTPELNKEGSWFVKGPTGKVVGTYADINIKNNETLAKEAATTYGEGYVAVPLETIRQDHLASGDSTFQNLIDYSDQLAKTGTGIKGSLAHTRIDTGPVTLKAMVKSLEEQFLNVGIRSHAAIFEPELNFAQQASDMATVSTRDNSGGFNIFDRYIATMFSRAPKAIDKNARFLQKYYQGAETGMDRTLSWMNSHFSEVTGSESTKIGARAMRVLLRKQSSEEEFKQFQKTLPDWSPFEEAQQWAESTFKEKSNLTSRDVSTSLAKLSSTMSLRFLDVGTAINNFAGLITNAPSVVTALRRLPNETREQWIDRTAAWGSEYADGIMTFSPTKATNAAIKALWSGELNEPMAEAAKHGYFNPEYASLHRALQTPMKPSQKAIENFVQVASTMADKSEAMSRQIAWGMGYKIGKDLHGFKDEKNAYIFANNFVNDMIGNYSPNNKPQMFQGALGLILGNFQTYMFNFYRRMYGNIERGDKAAVIAQYAAQASVFGAKSVPGYSMWNSYMQSNNTGSDDFTGRVRRDLPPGVGELILNGSLSNIPKIWGGLQGDGFAFYSRGSVDFTQPPATLLDMSKAPPIQFLSNTFNGVKATINNIFGAGGFSLQQQEEILANYTTNRALKSTMELAAGAKTSAKGDMIDAHTRDMMHVAAGLMGTQLSSVKSATEAYQRQQNVQLSQADARATLSAHTKSILRGGNFTTDDLQGVVQSYLDNGGNPQALGQWFRNDLMNATEPRTQKQLESLAKSGKMLEFEDMLATLQQNQNPNQNKGQ